MEYTLTVKVNNNLKDLIIGYSCRGWTINNQKVYKSEVIAKESLVADGTDYKATVTIGLNTTRLNNKAFKFNMQCAKCTGGVDGMRIDYYVITTDDTTDYSETDRLYFTGNVATDAKTYTETVPRVATTPFRYIQGIFVSGPVKSMRLYSSTSFGSTGTTIVVSSIQYKLDDTTYSTSTSHTFTVDTNTNYIYCNDFAISEELMCDTNKLTSIVPGDINSFGDPDASGNTGKIMITRSGSSTAEYYEPNAFVIAAVSFSTMFTSMPSEETGTTYGVVCGKMNDRFTVSSHNVFGYLTETDYDSLTNDTSVSPYDKKYVDSTNNITVRFKFASSAVNEENRMSYICDSNQSWQYKVSTFDPSNPGNDFTNLTTLPQYPLVFCLNETVTPCVKVANNSWMTGIVGPKDTSQLSHYIFGYSGGVTTQRYNRW